LIRFPYDVSDTTGPPGAMICLVDERLSRFNPCTV
jgi:hypothetical protein